MLPTMDNEVLDQVLRRLSAAEVARVGCTCRHLNEQTRTGQHALQLWRRRCRELLGDLAVSYVAAACSAGDAATWRRLYCSARAMDALHWSPAAPPAASLALQPAPAAGTGREGEASMHQGLGLVPAAAAAAVTSATAAALLAREGHTATAAGRLLVLLGGDLRDGPAPTATDVAVLDLAAGRVLRPRVHGRPPSSLRHHCAALMRLQAGSALHQQVAAAVAVAEAGAANAAAAAAAGAPAGAALAPAAAERLALEGHTLAVFGGLLPDGTEQASAREQLHLLWLHPSGEYGVWLHPAPRGAAPAPRAPACCQAVRGGAALLVSGGWVAGSIGGTFAADVSEVDGYLLMYVYMFDQADLTWTRVPTWPNNEPPRPGHAMVGPSSCPGPRKAALSAVRASPATGREEFLLLGGCGVDGLADFVPYVLDLETFVWRKGPVMGYLPASQGCWVAMSLTPTWLLLLAGGAGQRDRLVARVERLHLPSLSWKPPPQLVAPPPPAGAGAGACCGEGTADMCAGCNASSAGASSSTNSALMEASSLPALQPQQLVEAAGLPLHQRQAAAAQQPLLCPAAGCAAAAGVVVGGSCDGPYGTVPLPALHVLLPGPSIPPAQLGQRQAGAGGQLSAATVAARAAAAAAACSEPFAAEADAPPPPPTAAPAWHAFAEGTCRCGSCCSCLAAKGAAAAAGSGGGAAASCTAVAPQVSDAGEAAARAQRHHHQQQLQQQHDGLGSGDSSSSNGPRRRARGGGGGSDSSVPDWRGDADAGPQGGKGGGSKAPQVQAPVGWSAELEIAPAPRALGHSVASDPSNGPSNGGGLGDQGAPWRCGPAGPGGGAQQSCEWQAPAGSAAAPAGLGGLVLQILLVVLVVVQGLLLIAPSLTMHDP